MMKTKRMTPEGVKTMRKSVERIGAKPFDVDEYVGKWKEAMKEMFPSTANNMYVPPAPIEPVKFDYEAMTKLASKALLVLQTFNGESIEDSLKVVSLVQQALLSQRYSGIQGAPIAL